MTRARLILTALLVACASTPEAEPRLRTYVRVRNDHWLEQVVYAHCGARIRVGVAAGTRETLLLVPRVCEGRNVFFTTDPVGSQEVSRSDALDADVGGVLLLHVPARLNGYLYLTR